MSTSPQGITLGDILQRLLILGGSFIGVIVVLGLIFWCLQLALAGLTWLFGII